MSILSEHLAWRAGFVKRCEETGACWHEPYPCHRDIYPWPYYAGPRDAYVLIDGPEKAALYGEPWPFPCGCVCPGCEAFRIAVAAELHGDL